MHNLISKTDAVALSKGRFNVTITMQCSKPVESTAKRQSSEGVLPSEQGLEAALNRAETQSEKPNVVKCLRTNFWHSLRSIVK